MTKYNDPDLILELDATCEEKGVEWLLRKMKDPKGRTSFFIHITNGNVNKDPQASVFKASHSQLSVVIVQALSILGGR